MSATEELHVKPSSERTAAVAFLRALQASASGTARRYPGSIEATDADIRASAYGLAAGAIERGEHMATPFAGME